MWHDNETGNWVILMLPFFVALGTLLISKIHANHQKRMDMIAFLFERDMHKMSLDEYLREEEFPTDDFETWREISGVGKMSGDDWLCIGLSLMFPVLIIILTIFAIIS